jgi:hypothetical protein
VPSNFSSLTVTWYDETNNYVTTSNITDDVKSIPLFTDSGTGEVNQASLIIRSLEGNYNVTGSVIFAEFDRIRIQCTDLAGNSYDRFFEIFNIIPSQTKGEGTLLTIECLGIEYHTQQIHMAKPYYFEDSYLVGISVGQIYNLNRGTKQPELIHHTSTYSNSYGYGNGLPMYNANNWDFAVNEDSCYNRWIDLIDNGGQAVEAGGSLTFYELSFLTPSVNTIHFKLRPSGDNTTIKQIKNSVITGVKVGEQEGMLSNPTGTNVLAWGSNDHGTLPVDHSKYNSHVERFIFRPEWISGVYYNENARIKVTPTTEVAPSHYKVKTGQAHTSSTSNKPPNATYWEQIDMGDEFGDTVQYSPWTDEKATLWLNSGCNPSKSTFTTGGFIDINCVINEEKWFRTWVDAIAIDNDDLDTLASKYSYDSTDRSKFPRGFRVLVKTNSPSGDLANFANMVVEVYPTNSIGGIKWQKLYNFDTINTKVQVAVIDEGKVYTDTISGSAGSPSHSWSDISGADYGNDCFHPYTTAPANTDGVDLVDDIPNETTITRSKLTDPTNRPDITKSGSTQFGQNIDSAVAFTAVAQDALTSAASDASDPVAPYYTNGIGFTIRFPFPCNTENIGNSVGDLYGGGHATSPKYEPATLDVQNMNYTSNGLQGFNHGQSSEDYGQISAVAMWLKFSQKTLGNAELDDEHRFRAWFVDTKDNVVYQDFVITHSNNWEDIRLPISGFRNYRGRKPIYGYSAAIATVIPPKELEVINIFEWRNIKMFGVQYQPQYDKYGRFNPGKNVINSDGDSVTWGNILGCNRVLTMDGFRFIKPLLATSGQNTDRNLEPDFLQFPDITNYHQLEGAAKSHLEIEKFKHKEFNIESSGDEIFDVPFGDSFYLHNDNLVSEDDKPGQNEDNNIKLVAKRIEYSITKPVGGKGGLRRKIKGSKVFT